MPAAEELHTQHFIKCPKNVDPSQVNPQGFKDFIPPNPNISVKEVQGLTLKQEKRTCRWQITVELQGGAEVYNDNIKRYNLRTELDYYKPRNTNLLDEKKAIRNGEYYWIFEYEVICKCPQSQVF